MSLSTTATAIAHKTVVRTGELFKEQQQSIIQHTDQLFAKLMLCQWIFSIGIAWLISPTTWDGPKSSYIHPHVWMAVFFGAVISSLPIFLALKQPGTILTRHVVAVGQMMMSALLIHLTGGRIETHFHVFGSLAILAFYRDWKVLVSATVVVYVDHLTRGALWPQSVYGVAQEKEWWKTIPRSLEHAGWVIFEVTFLIISIRKSLEEMHIVAERQAKLEEVNENIERTVDQRTEALTKENLERRQAEEQLRKSEAQLAQAQQIAALGSWDWDIEANKVTWSEETRRLYGRKPEDAGRPMEALMDRIHPDDLPRVDLIMSEAMRTGKPFTCDHRVRLPDGTERIMHARGEMVKNEHGKPVKMLGIVQDITQAKRAQDALHRSEEQLRQSQKMEAVGRLAGGIAHDFNNLLTVIGGYTALALQKTEKTHPMRKPIEEVLAASDRASALTIQLLAFSRKQVLQPRVLNLNLIVQGMEKMLLRLIGEDIEFSTVFDDSLWKVKADPGQIEQVILNLAVNARDAMPRGGKLIIRTSNVTVEQQTQYRGRVLDTGRYVMLAISDNGVGMTEEVQAHLFEPFFTTKGVGKGTGLGLATSYGIISQSGGDIRVYSEPNMGTTFKVFLPITDAPAEPAADPIPDSPDGSESIAVVEDDNSVRTFTAMVLRGRGYEVEEFSDPFKALDAIRGNRRFDLILTDVIMPKMSGKVMGDKIKEYIPAAKIMLMSGYTDDALGQHGVLTEGFYFIEKPFSPVQLARKVRQILDAPPHPASERGGPARM